MLNSNEILHLIVKITVGCYKVLDLLSKIESNNRKKKMPPTNDWLRHHYNARRDFIKTMNKTTFTTDQFKSVVLRQMDRDAQVFSMLWVSPDDAHTRDILARMTNIYRLTLACVDTATTDVEKTHCFVGSNSSPEREKE